MNFIKNMNLPNRLTCLRMLMIIPFVVCMLMSTAGRGWGLAALILFIAASLTDLLDGKIARARNLITDFGKFMDPLADKLLVCSALICLVSLERIPAWIVILIISREFIISGLRLVAADNGIVIAASMWGKAKTVLQMVMIVMLIIGFTEGVWAVIQNVVMYAACALTVISLIDYLYKNRQVLAEQK